MFHVPEEKRLLYHPLLASRPEDGNNGAFRLKPIIGNRWLFIIASDGEGWEHVSVHAHDAKPRTPTWEEMCHVKAVFWDPEDAVMQLHPRESEYINQHENVLHLWRPINAVIPEPPSIMVGTKEPVRL
jgi:hypothetical protein